MADVVTSTFTANTSALEASLQTILDRVQKLESATGKAGTELNTLSDRSHGAAQGVEHAGGAAQMLAGHLQALSGHTSGLSELFARFGLEAGGVGKNLGTAAEGVEALGSKIPILAAVAAAAVAVGIAFMTLKEGVMEAGQVDLKLDLIANSAKNAGADFGKSREDVKAWGETLSDQTGAPITSLLAGVQRMVAAHIDLNTAMTLTADAEKIAIASGRDQTEVETALQQAVLGRTRGLVALGIITKEEAKNGISLAEVNERIQKQTEGAVKIYQDSLPGAFAITSNKIKELLKDLGEDSGLIGAVVGVMKWVQSIIPIVKQFAEEAIGKAHEAAAKFGPVLDELKPTLERLWAALVGVGKSIMEVNDRVTIICTAIFTLFKPVLEWLAGAVGNTLSYVAGLFKTVFDGIVTVLDVFIAIFTGDWSKFHQDLWKLADDGLTALNNLFGGHLADIIGAIEGMFEYGKTKFSNLMKMAADTAAFVANPMQGAINLAVDYAGAPDLQAMIAKHTGEVAGALKYVNNQAAPPGSKATHITHGGVGSGSTGSIKDQELGGSASKTKKPKKEKAAKGGTTSISYQEEIPADAAKSTDVYTSAQKALEQAIKRTTDGEKGLAESIKLATTTEAEHAAQAAYDAKVVADLEAQHKLLNDAIFTEATAHDKLTAKVEAARLAHNALTAQQKQYVDQVAKGIPLTDDQSAAYNDLEEKIKKAKAQYTELDKALKANDANLLKNRDSLAALDDKLQSVKNHAAELAAGLARADEVFEKKRAEKYQDDLTLFDATSQQKLAHYQALLDALSKDDVDYYNKKHDLETKIDGERVAIWKENINAHKAMLNKMTADVTTFLDDVIVQHKSFRDILKSIYDQILQAFIAMVAKMIVQSTLFKSIFGNLAGGGSSGGGGGIFSSLFSGAAGGGGAGSASLLSTVPGFSSLNGMPVELGGQTIAKLTGSTSGVSPFSPGGMFVNSAGGVTLLGAAGVAAGAVGVGAFGAKITGGNQTNGAIGGLLGVGGLIGAQALMTGVGMGPALGALLASGPAGWALLAAAGLLGGMAGGVFGPHWGPDSNSPDRHDTQNWGKADTNWNGDNNQDFNGTKISADAAFNVSQGGTPMYKLVEDWAKSQKDPSKLTGDALSAYNAIKNLTDGTFTGDVGVVREHDGIANLANGKTTSVTDLVALEKAYLAATAGTNTGATATTPIYSLSRMGPDFNTARMSAWAANITTTTGTTAPLGGGPQVTPPPITINVNGVIGDKSEVARYISEELARNNYYGRGNQRLQ